MNELLKQLAKQAGLSHMPSNYPDMADLYKGADFELEQFAQLTARELIVDFYRRYLDITSDEDITVQVERYIKDQFGVEQ